MSSVPGEVPRDILLPLDRWTLDDVQFTDGRFLQLILQNMSDVCLREVSFACFQAPSQNENVDATALVRIDGRPERQIAHEDTARLFSQFMQALRSSRVELLYLNGLAITPELAALVLQTPIVTDFLKLHGGSCGELTPAQFRDVLLHFQPTSLDFTAFRLRASHVTDELIRALSEKHVQETDLHDLVLADSGSFAVTDDAIVDFFVQEDVPSSREEYAQHVQLAVGNGSFTKDLFKRLVEASSVSTRTQPIHIDVSPLRFEDEDLRDYEHHLSNSGRGELRIYDFPGEQNGANAAMHLQIVLHPGSRLEVIRAQRPDSFFHELDE